MRINRFEDAVPIIKDVQGKIGHLTQAAGGSGCHPGHVQEYEFLRSNCDFIIAFYGIGYYAPILSVIDPQLESQMNKPVTEDIEATSWLEEHSDLLMVWDHPSRQEILDRPNLGSAAANVNEFPVPVQMGKKDHAKFKVGAFDILATWPRYGRAPDSYCGCRKDGLWRIFLKSWVETNTNHEYHLLPVIRDSYGLPFSASITKYMISTERDILGTCLQEANVFSDSGISEKKFKSKFSHVEGLEVEEFVKYKGPETDNRTYIKFTLKYGKYRTAVEDGGFLD